MVIWKQDLDACVTEACRTSLRQRISRSKFNTQALLRLLDGCLESGAKHCQDKAQVF
jgi:hypothetical protein